MKCIYVYVMTALMLLSLQSTAQKKENGQDGRPFKRLYIGDTVPLDAIVFNNVHNYPGGKAKLSDFKGKYIILDFWSKGCSSCIAAFPHMEELQKQFKDKIQVLLVTHDTEEELATLFKNSKNVKETKLPMVVGEQVLTKELFPNESVPYHVWIDREGKVIATTYESETIAKNLIDFITDQPLNLLVKNDLGMSKSVEKEVAGDKKSFLKIGNGTFLGNVKYFAQIPQQKVINALPEPQSTITNLPYYSMFMTRLLNYDSSTQTLQKFINEDNKQAKGFRALNMSIENYYRWAFAESENPFSVRVVLDGKAKLLMENITDTTNGKRHVINNTFCYESNLPDYSFEKAKKVLQQDLIRFFGMTANIEEREMKCVVLFQLGMPAEKKLWSKNQDPKFEDSNLREVKYTSNSLVLRNVYFNSIASYLGLYNRDFDAPIVIDEIKFEKKELFKFIDIKLNCSLKLTPENIPLIQHELARYGLGLKEENRKMRVMVLRAAF